MRFVFERIEERHNIAAAQAYLQNAALCTMSSKFNFFDGYNFCVEGVDRFENGAESSACNYFFNLRYNLGAFENKIISRRTGIHIEKQPSKYLIHVEGY